MNSGEPISMRGAGGKLCRMASAMHAKMARARAAQAITAAACAIVLSAKWIMCAGWFGVGDYQRMPAAWNSALTASDVSSDESKHSTDFRDSRKKSSVSYQPKVSPALSSPAARTSRQSIRRSESSISRKRSVSAVSCWRGVIGVVGGSLFKIQTVQNSSHGSAGLAIHFLESFFLCCIVLEIRGLGLGGFKLNLGLLSPYIE